MSKPIAVLNAEQLAKLAALPVEKAYKGKKQGCRCGCNGTYFEGHEEASEILAVHYMVLAGLAGAFNCEATFGTYYADIDVKGKPWTIYFAETTNLETLLGVAIEE